MLRTRDELYLDIEMKISTGSKMAGSKDKLSALTIEKLLGPPANIPSHDMKRFREVHDLVRRSLNPNDFLGELDAREYAVMIFEEMKYKQYQHDLVQGACFLSTKLMLEASGLPTVKYEEEQLTERCNLIGLTDGVIEANAYNLQRDVYEKLENLINSRSRARRRLEKRALERARSAKII